MINQTGLVAANNIALLLSLLTAQTMANHAVRMRSLYELFSQETWIDREQEDLILFDRWWTNEIKFNKENSQSYAQDSACSFEHYSS